LHEQSIQDKSFDSTDKRQPSCILSRVFYRGARLSRDQGMVRTSDHSPRLK